MEKLENELKKVETKLAQVSEILGGLRKLFSQMSKKYQCKWCDYSSDFKSNVNKHQKICKHSEADDDSCNLEEVLHIKPPRIDERDEKLDTDHVFFNENIEEMAERLLFKCKLDVSMNCAPRPAIRLVHKLLFQTILEDHCFHMNNNGDVIYYNSKKCDFSYFEHIHRLATAILTRAVDQVNAKPSTFKATDYHRSRFWTVWDTWLPIPKHRKDLTPVQKAAQSSVNVEMQSLHCYLKNHKIWFDRQQSFKT